MWAINVSGRLPGSIKYKHKISSIIITKIIRCKNNINNYNNTDKTMKVNHQNMLIPKKINNNNYLSLSHKANTKP